MSKTKFTKIQVKNWLGSDSSLEDATEIIIDLANGDYLPEQMRKDILSSQGE